MADNQDWFAQNAPKATAAASSGDWFTANSPKPSTPPAEEPVPWYKQTLNAATKSFIPNPKPYEVYDPAIQKVENFASGLPNGLRQGVAAVGTFPLHWLNSAVKTTRAMASPLGMATMGAGAVTGPAGAVLRTGMGAGFGAKGAVDAAQAVSQPMTASSVEQGLGGVAAALSGGIGLKSDAGLLASKVGAKYAPKLYKSALKPSTTIAPDKAARIVETGIREGIPVSSGGLRDLNDLIVDLNVKIADEIASRPGRTIDPNAVATRANQIKGTFRDQVNASQDLATIEDSRLQFLSEQGAKPGKPAIAPQPTGLLDANGRTIMGSGTPAQPPKPAPPIDALKGQRIKQGTYQQLSSKAYGEMQTATKEAQKALARGIKEELEGQFPELKSLNARDSQLIQLQDVLERAVSRISNHQLLGIGTPIAAGGLKAITGSNKVAAIGGIIKGVLDNPIVKSRLAIALSRAGKGQSSPAVGAAQVAAYVNALAASSQSDENTPNHQ